MDSVKFIPVLLSQEDSKEFEGVKIFTSFERSFVIESHTMHSKSQNVEAMSGGFR